MAKPRKMIFRLSPKEAFHESVRDLLGHTLMYHGNDIAAECATVAGRKAASKRLGSNIFAEFKKEFPEVNPVLKKELTEHCDEILQENIDGACFLTPTEGQIEFTGITVREP